MVLDFPARGVFVGRENNDMVFSRIDGTRLVLKDYHAPQNVPEDVPQNAPADGAPRDEGPPAIVVDGREMTHQAFFDALGEDDMPQAGVVQARNSAYHEYSQSELSKGISGLSALDEREGGSDADKALGSRGNRQDDLAAERAGRPGGVDALGSGSNGSGSVSPGGGHGSGGNGSGGTGGTGNSNPSVASATVTIAEDTISVSGALPSPTDPNAGDILSFIAKANAAGLYGTLSVDANGNYTYILNNALSAVQGLGVGESLTDTFTFTVTDNHGGTANNTLTVTITGTNDAPVLAATTVNVSEDSSITSGILPTPTDVDVHDVVSFVPQTNTAGLYGTLSVDANGNYTYVLNNTLPAVQGLGAGENLTDTFTVTVTDNHGGTSSAVVTVNINGSNDAPIVSAVATSIFEDTASVSGTLPAPVDPDLHDVASYLPQTNTVGLYGTLTLDASGNYTYTLNNSLSAVQGLGVGESLTDTFTFTASDGHGGTSSSTLTVTINGSNDAPVLAATVVGVDKDDVITNGTLPTPTDVDVHDTVSFTPLTNAPGSYGTFSVDADGHYTYVLDTSLPAVQGLGPTDSLTDTFTVTVTDNHGASSSTVITVSVNGSSNDAPTVAAALASIGEDTPSVTGVLPTPGDPDPHDVVTFVPQAGTAGLYGTFSVDASGNYTYTLNNSLPAVQGLGAGESLTETFTFTVSDGRGGTASNTLTVTIDGSNDAPVVTAATASIVEDTAGISGTLPPAVDPDLHDVATFIPQTNTAGLYGTLTLDASGNYTYTLNNSLPAVQGLGVGESLTETFTFTATDGHGGTSSNTLTVTINGTNDLPTVSAAAASIAEDTAGISGMLPTPVDVDVHDTVTFTPQTNTAGLYGTLSVDAAGNYTYALNNALPAVQGLGVGESLTETFTFSVTDGHGGTASNTLTVTINGANDAPTVSAATASIVEDTVDIRGTLPAPVDADIHDTVTFTPQTNAPGGYGTLSVDANGNYTYTLNNSLPAVQGLGVGESLTDTFTFTVTDNHGATASNTLTVTINGANDAPTVSAATASIIEDTASVSGTLPAPVDADIHDTVTFTPQTNAPGSYGTLTMDASGNYTYTLNNALSAVQGLGVGESLTDTFTFTASDGHGGTASSSLTVTINGSNDAPVLAATVVGVANDMAITNGTLPMPTDVDVHDTVSFTPLTNAPGSYGTFSVDADGHYTYVLDTSLPAVQGLGPTDSLTDTFTVTVTDNHGASSSTVITVSVNGSSNDAPTVAAALASIGEDTPSVTGVLPTPGDPDPHDVVTFVPQAGTAGLYGTFSVDASGNYTYTLNNSLPAVQGLGAGESLTDTFTFTVSDGRGGTGSNTLTVTIDGSNDAPTVSAATTSIVEDTAGISGVLPTPVDADLHDTVTFMPQTNAPGSYGTLSVDADGNYTYTLNNSLPAVQGLGVGESLTDTFTFTVTDNHGATATNTLTVTINGSNDAPVLAATTVNVAEGSAITTGTLPMPTDVDVHDVVSFTPLTNAPGNYGTFSVDANGNYSYVLNTSLPAVQGLGVGESLTDTFTVTVSDNHGGSSSTVITVSVNGSNDVPTVSAVTTAIAEDTASISGTLPTPVDADIHDTVTFTPQTNAPGSYGTLSVDADGNYTYTLNNSLPAVQALGVGESLTETFTFSVTDNHGATASNTLTVTINGTNDAPTVSAAATVIAEDTASVSGTLPTPTDVDVHDVVSFTPQTNAPGSYGTLSVDADGKYTYTLDNSLPAVQGLGVGESLTDTFTFTVTDNHGGTGSNTLTVTINGSNDASTVTAAATAIAEDTPTVSGTLPTPTDVDVHDVVSFVPQTNAPGSYGTFSVDADGNYSYVLNTSLPAVQGLGAGESLTDTFTVTVSDNHGGSSSTVITVSVNGSNDAPTVAAATASIAEDTPMVSGTLPTPVDADIHDVVTFSPQTNTAGLYGTLSVDANGNYIYVLNNTLPVVQGLGVGESLTETFTFSVTDNHGATASNTLTVTVNGTNDLPVLTATTVNIAEGTAITSGTLPQPTDVDVHDVVSLTPQTNAAGAYGTFSVDADGNYSYVLNTSLPAVQGLGAGESLTDTFTVTVSDNHGGTASASVTMHINGSNDVPTVAAATAAIAEDTASVSGTLPAPVDPDLHDVVSFVPQAGAVGQYGTLVLDASGNYIYTLNNSLPSVQGLGVGESLTDTFTFTVTDNHGGTGSNTLTVTINGTNDAPVLAATTVNVAEDSTISSGSLPQPTDVDVHDVVSFTPLSNAPGSYGTFSVDADGKYTYVLNNTLPAVQGLGAGESLTDTFTVTVSDNHGGSSSTVITVSINGSNDAPTVAAATAAIAEDTPTVSGTLPAPVDPDLHDVVSFVPQTNTPGLYGTFSVDADGNYTYTLNNVLPVVQGLGVGESLTETFTFMVTDNHGATATNTLTVTVNGTNDAPTVAAATAAIAEDTASVSGTLPAPVDADIHDIATFTPQTNAPGSYGTLTLDANGNYTYTLNNSLPAVQGLGVGESLTDTFTVTASDGHGGTASNTLTVTINGTNDLPVLAATTANIAEVTAVTNGTLPMPTDADIHDTVTFTPQTNAPGSYGTFSVDADGNYSYALNTSLPAVQGLGAGESLTDTFVVTVSDNHGGTSSAVVTMSINGSNDAPTVAAATAAIAEDTASVSGTLPAPVDADIHDTVTFTPQTNAAGLYGTLTLDASGNYVYTLNNSLPAVQGLGVGESLTETFTFTVTDNHGGTGSNTLTVTINGTNDAPTVAAATAAIAEDTAAISGTLPAPVDPDLHDVVSFAPQANTAGLYGTFSVNADGNYTYTLNNALPAVQGLGVGEKLTDTFTYTVSDGHGGTASNTLTVTVNGTNDAPTVSAATATIAEDTASVSGTLPTPVDADIHDTVTFSPQTNTPGLYGTLSVDASGNYTYTLNNGLPAVQGLGVGESLTETFTYAISDGRGGTGSNTLTVTINGTNDIPVLAATTVNIAEGTAVTNGTLPMPTDADVHDVVSFTPLSNAAGTYGTFSVDASGNYTYTLNNSLPAVQGLGVGESLTDTLTFTVTDNHGATASNTLTVTINGTNDAPTVSAAVNSIFEDTATVSGTLPAPADPDLHDVVSFVPQTNTAGLYGTLSVNASGNYTYTLNNALPAVQGLGVGDKLTDTFTFTVSDGHGGTASNILTLTINGTNDAPSVGASTASIAKTDVPYSGHLVTPTDPDLSDIVTFIPKTNELGSYGRLTLNADGSYVYTLNTGLLAVINLLLNQHLTEKFTYTVTDGHGGTASNTLTITISGGGGSLSVEAAVNVIAEDSINVSGLLPSPTNTGLLDVISYLPQTATVGLYGTLTVNASGGYVYTLNNALPVVQGLGVGEHLTDTFTFTVSNGLGGTVSNTLTLTINGTNDIPTVGAATAVIAEDAVSVSGALPVPTDVDLHDVLTFLPQTGTVGLYGKLTVDANGNYTYILNNALPAVQALGVGEHLTDTFTFTVSDGHGGTVSNTLTLTIDGTNDIPTVGAAAAVIAEDAVSVSGTLPTPVDVDVHDVLTFLPLTNKAGLYGTLTLDANGNYTYVLNNALPAVQGLGVGEKLTDTFTFTVSDGHGGTVSNTLTLTINGTNDIPTVGAATAVIAEDAVSVSGTLPVPVDADVHDVLTFLPQTGTTGLYGTLMVDASGNYTYVLNNALPAVQGLGVGEKLTDTFSFTVSDGHGGTATNTLTLTINGTNNIPTVGAATAVIAEDTASVSGTLPVPTDVDVHDVLAFLPQTATAGLYGTLTVDASGNYTYILNNALPAVQGLGVGEKLTDTFSFTVSDGHGGTATNSLTLTINGTNDAPVLVPTILGIAKDIAVTSGTLPLPTDVDVHDVVSFTPQTNAPGSYGTFTLSADGHYTYTLNTSLPAVLGLGSGESLTDAFTVTVSDGHGGTASAVVTMSINGSNQAPTVAAATAVILEDAVSVSGDLPAPTDPNIHDVLTFIAQNNVLGSYGTLTLDAAGHYTYTLNNALPVVQGLGVGEKLTDTFTFKVSDGHGGTATNTLTLTINGTNDLPSVGAATASIVEDAAGVSGVLPVPGDPDLHDVVSFIPQTAALGLYGTLSIDAGGNYTYTLNNALPVVQGLGVGEKLTDTFTFTVSDNHGGTASNTLTVTINGSNDVPTVGAAAASIIEDAASVSGVLPVPVDPDLHDVVSFIPQTAALGLYGTLTLDASGNYTYALNNALPAVQGLGVGEKLTDTFTFKVSDGHGGTASNTLTVTINGANDAPVLTAAAASIFEDTASVSGKLPAPVDPDLHDVVSFVPQTAAVGLYGTLNIDAGGNYTYTLNNALPVVQGLGVGEKFTDTFTFTASDNHGGTASSTLTLTINGTNDIPTVGAATTAIFEDTAGVSGKLPTPVDADIHDTLAFIAQTNAAGLYGTLTLDASGNYTYNLNNALPAVQGLGVGEKLTDTFTFRVSDGHGGMASNTLTVTINGTNDIPTVAAATASIFEDTASVSGKLPTPVDADIHDTLTFATQTNAAGLYGTLTLDASGNYTYKLNNGLPAVQGLGVGDKLTDSFTFVVSDGHGGTTANILTLTINGTNDAPSVGASTGIMLKTDATLSGHLVTPTDPDNDLDHIPSDTLSFIPKTNELGSYGRLTLNADGSYVYTLNTGLLAVVGLLLNQKLTDTFTYTVTDGHGGTASNTLAVTIKGGLGSLLSLDAITTGLVDTVSNVVGAVTAPLNAVGNVVYSLVDNAGLGLGVGLYGSLTLQANGTYNYQLNTGLSAVVALGVGEKLTESFTFTATDSLGKTATSTISIAINGTNDAPQVLPVALSIAEHGSSIVSGLLNITDPDSHDTPHCEPGSTTGSYGTLIVNANGSYSYVLDQHSSAVLGLGVGETLTESFPVTVVDGHGGSASTVIKITINGQNDTPTVAAANADLSVTAVLSGSSGHGLEGILPTPHDPDIHDLPTYVPQHEAHGLYGDLTLQADGSYVYTLHDNQTEVKNLGLGLSLQDVFTYTVDDGHGGTATNTLTLTIHGSDAAPAVMALASLGVDSTHGDSAPATALSATVALDTEVLDHDVADNLLDGGSTHNSLSSTNMAAVAGDNAATSSGTQEGHSAPGHEAVATSAAQAAAAQDGDEAEGFFHDQSSAYREPILSEDAEDSLFSSGASTTSQSLNANSSAVHESGQTGTETPAAAVAHENAAAHTAAAAAAPDTHSQTQQESPGTAQSAPAAPAETAVADASASASHADQLAALQHLVQNGQ